MTEDQMKAENPEAFKRAIVMTSAQQAMFRMFVELNMNDSDILSLLTSSLVRLAEVTGFDDDKLIERLKVCRQIRQFVDQQAQGTMQ